MQKYKVPEPGQVATYGSVIICGPEETFRGPNKQPVFQDEVEPAHPKVDEKSCVKAKENRILRFV